MSTPLPTGGGTSGPPSIKLPAINNSFTFAVIDCNPDVPDTDFRTGQPKTTRAGKPKKQTVLTVLAIAADGATAGKDATPVTVGEVYSVFVNSYAKFDPDRDKLGGSHVSFGAACDKLEGGLTVGDVGQWKYLQNLPSQGAEERKDRKFAFRKPKPEEAAQSARCEQLRNELRGNQLATAGAGYTDEEAF